MSTPPSAARERDHDGAGMPPEGARPIPAMPRLADAIVATVREPLMVLDASLVVCAANPAFFEAFRLDPAETLGYPLPEIGDGPLAVTALRELLAGVIPSGRDVEGFEIDDEFPRVGRRVMLLNARRIEAELSRPYLILLAFEDITARRDAERKASLHAEELRRSNRDLEDFAAAASHDLQEPLRKIQAFGDLLAETSGSTLDSTARGYLSRMLDATVRMRALVDDLLAYARVATAPRPPQAVDLGRIAREVLVDLEVQVSGLGARIEVGSLPTVAADPVQMRQLLQNLLANALKFRRDGEPPVVRLYELDTAGPRRSARRIVVEDQGIGFEPQYCEKIFGLFERLHSRNAYEGTGVGLALCRRIVQRHGGSIHATSTPGRGATFVVELPSGGF